MTFGNEKTSRNQWAQQWEAVAKNDSDCRKNGLESKNWDYGPKVELTVGNIWELRSPCENNAMGATMNPGVGH